MARLRLLAKLTSLAVALGYGWQVANRATAEREEQIARGLKAQRPWEIPWAGWKDSLIRTWDGIFEARLLSSGAAVAFFALLAVIPGLSVLISFYGLFADPGSVSNQLPVLAVLLPESVQQLLQEHAQRIATQSTGKISFNITLSLLVATWGANAAVKGLFEGLNVIYGEEEKRSFLAFNIITLLTTLAGVCIIAVAVAVITLTPVVLDAAQLGESADFILRLLRWPLLFVLGAAGIAALYQLGPSRSFPRLEWVLPGALGAAFLWAVSSSIFSWYVAALSNYNAMYGSLAAVVVFMTWLWMSAVIVLLGAELNSELERQTAQDTTWGEPKPLGMRGAVVADAVGAAVPTK